MLDEIRKQLAEYEIAIITKQNFEQVFNVYNANQDFFMLVKGEKATIESSISDISALPPNCTIEQKIYISIWKNGKVVGILDLIEGYPDKTSVWIGLLLVHRNIHGRGIGSKIVCAVLNSAKMSGYKSAQLGVIENNAKGIDFWQKHGFSIFRHSGNVVIMARSIV